MKHKQSLILFKNFYNKTFNEAYGYVLAKTADIDATSKILKESFALFFKNDMHLNEDVKRQRSQLFRFLQKQINEYIASLPEQSLPKGRKIKKYEQLLEEMLQTEFVSIRDKTILDEVLDQILSFVDKYHFTSRRAFFLYYFFGFNFERIAAELNSDVLTVGNHVYLITKEIVKFLSKEQTQDQAQEN